MGTSFTVNWSAGASINLKRTLYFPCINSQICQFRLVDDDMLVSLNYEKLIEKLKSLLTSMFKLRLFESYSSLFHVNFTEPQK